MSDISVMFHAFSKLTTIANPISMMAIFLSFASGWQRSAQRRCANKTCLVVAVILIATAFLGSNLMSLVGIDIASLQIGGGICLLLVSLNLMKQSSTPENFAEQVDRVAIVPLAMPIIAGPAVIASLILTVDQGGGTLLVRSYAAAGSMLFSLLLWLFFFYSEYLAKWLGQKLLTIVTQITALILVSMAAKIIISGINQSLQLH